MRSATICISRPIPADSASQPPLPSTRADLTLNIRIGYNSEQRNSIQEAL